MNKLIFDIGNTYLKGCYGRENVYRIQRSSYSKPEIRRQFKEFLGRFPKRPDAVFVITQNRKLIPLVKSALYFKFPNIVIEIPEINFNSPLKVSYANTLGQDRYYASAGAFIKFNTYRNILVIDMGTATTVNFVSNGVLKGGMISPGGPASAVALAELTTLPEIKLKNKFKLINSDTENAINSGIILQQKYFIENTIRSYKKIYNNLLTVITGGGYKYLEGNIEGVDVYEKNLVLEGINFIINLSYGGKK
jgi:pantothenate kinase type III